MIICTAVCGFIGWGSMLHCLQPFTMKMKPYEITVQDVRLRSRISTPHNPSLFYTQSCLGGKTLNGFSMTTTQIWAGFVMSHVCLSFICDDEDGKFVIIKESTSILLMVLCSRVGRWRCLRGWSLSQSSLDRRQAASPTQGRHRLTHLHTHGGANLASPTRRTACLLIVRGNWSTQRKPT